MAGEIHKEELAVVLDDNRRAEIDEEEREECAALLFLPKYPTHESTGDDRPKTDTPHAEVLIERIETGVSIGERRLMDKRQQRVDGFDGTPS